MKLKFKNCFSMRFHNYEIILPKERAHFQYGYAVVNPRYNIEFKTPDGIIAADEPLVGIIDSNYNPILNLTFQYVMPHVEVFPNDLFVVRLKDNYMEKDGDNYSVFRCGFIQGEFQTLQDLKAVSFERISESVIKLDTIVSEDGAHLYALYDVVSQELLTPYFYQIGDFQYDQEFETDVADAIFVTKNVNNEPVKILCKINRRGEASSTFWNLDTGVFYDFPELQDVVDFVNEESVSR